MAIERLQTLLVSLTTTQLCLGHQIYQQRVPNGEMVPHPCMANNVWKGVGHFDRLGNGLRNPFGEDFQRNNLVWNKTLCNMDSDGDGKTNGQELGDPDCLWVSGQGPPDITIGLSHPGICEPVGSDRCGPKPNWLNCEQEEFVCPAIEEPGICEPVGSDRCGPKPNWLNCEQEEFVCPAIEEPETFNFTVRFPETPVPDDVTTYTCMFFAMPSDQEYHLVAYTPHIDNEAVMHHIVVYGCAGDISQDVTLNTPRRCGMGSGHRDCSDIIGSWSVGMVGSCAHPQSGFLIGGERGYKYASFQIHWNNPGRRSDYIDSSGINFYLTPKLRMYNAGVLVIGQIKLVIPPNESSVVLEGGCAGKCTSTFLKAPINITAAFNHMHYLGKSQYTEIRRNGYKVVSLSDDEEYNYDNPVIKIYNDAIVANPGDDLRTTCVFKSTSRVAKTYFGDETADEMCLAFLTFFPKENMQKTLCTSWASLEMCELNSGFVQGCNLSRLSDMSDQYIANHYSSIEQKCSTTHCRKECKEYIKTLKSEDPCYRGDVYKFRKESPFRRGGEEAITIQELQFYSRTDSCDTELALEMCGKNEQVFVTGTTSLVFITLFLKFVL